MKKIFLMMAAMLAIGGTMAQTGKNLKEYVSVLVTFSTTDVPQDSLDKYGVVLQERTGMTARGLVEADRYQAFVASNLVERVQPSTRVLLGEGQVFVGAPQHKCSGEHHGDARCSHPKDGEHCQAALRKAPKEGDGERCAVRRDQGVRHHGGENRGYREDVRQHLLDEQTIADEDARGWYVGLLLGGSRNNLRVDVAPEALANTTWLTNQGINLDARVGYQFNQWFGIRSGLQMISKNYATEETGISPTDTIYLDTRHTNTYLQLPVMADFSFGNEVIRVHVMFGGYAGWWCTQYRNGYIYSPNETTGIGWKRGFEEGYDQRFDAGLAGGASISLRVTPQWQLHFGGDYFYGLVSCKQDPYKQYNKTSTFEMGMTYHF